ncbi:hypothetical protein QWY16_07505 [Planococcus shenhongbingii]|nr:hypothetical protein [Planococcus sp. N016]WKA59945.1 hypothetical protein QWY16_07505 [Planococcus sp. N016]
MKSGSVRKAPTSAEGLVVNGVLCHSQQGRSDSRGWALQLDKKSGSAR